MSDNHYRREIFDRFPDIYKYLFREEIMKKDQEIFQERLNHHHDELRWLYTELYHNDDMLQHAAARSKTATWKEKKIRTGSARRICLA